MSQEFECPECGNSYDTKRGLHIHIGQKHQDQKEEILDELKESEKESKKEDKGKKEKDEESGKGQEDGFNFSVPLKPIHVGLIVVILVLGSYVFYSSGTPTSGELSASEAGQEAVNFLGQIPQLQGADVSLVNSSDTGSGVYELNVEISAQGQSQISTHYISKDGELLFPTAEVGSSGEKGLSEEEIGSRAVERIANLPQMAQNNVTVEFIESLGTENGLNKISISISGPTGPSQNMTVHVTPDAKYIFPQNINITKQLQALSEDQDEGEQSPTGDIVKSETPTANAFIMSYCPYGLQFLKAYVPVMELLGDEADLNVNFVDYAMHGKKELDENLRMYCVQKEQPEKLTDYLRCSVKTEDANKEKCFEEAGLDSEVIKTCVNQTDEEYNVTELYKNKSTWRSGRFPPFPVESDLNQEYGVGGSPTFIINGEKVNAGRSPESIKESVCSAFKTKPDDCDTELSTQTESAGLGEIGSGSGSSSGGQC